MGTEGSTDPFRLVCGNFIKFLVYDVGVLALAYLTNNPRK